MKTLYMLQHRAEGRVTSHVFAQPPTDEQKAAIVQELDKRHAPVLAMVSKHIDPDEADQWPKVIEISLMETPDEIPDLKELPGGVNKGMRAAPMSGAAVAETPDTIVTGKGTVTGGKS